MSDMNDNTPVQVAEVNVPAPRKPQVRKPAVRKASSNKSTELSLTTVSNANGTPNLVLASTMKVKFPELVLVKQADPNAKNPVHRFRQQRIGRLGAFHHGDCHQLYRRYWDSIRWSDPVCCPTC